MSRLYGSLSGDERSEVTRTAHRSIVAHPRGWSTGIRTYGSALDDGRDSFSVAVSGGSNNGRRRFDLAEVTEVEGGWLYVSVVVQDGGRSVYYLDRDGEQHTRTHGPEDTCGRCETDRS